MPQKLFSLVLSEKDLNLGTRLTVRIEAAHSPDCSDAADDNCYWVATGESEFLDFRGTKRGSGYRWSRYQCNGTRRDAGGFCSGRVLCFEWGVSRAINLVLTGDKSAENS